MERPKIKDYELPEHPKNIAQTYVTIRNEGFQVGGHFRFQPYGPRGEHKRYRVIYIEPYMKSYRAK